MIVHNEDKAPQTFTIGYKGRSATAILPGGAVATYVW
jgi:hypothetical protein